MKKLFYFCFSAIIFVSCIEKRITRLDTKAVQRVEAKRSLLDQVFVEGLKLHPCANESKIITVRDTMIEVKTDTVRFYGVPDTIRIKTIKTITLRDTIKETIVDGLKVNILSDSIQAKEKALSYLKGQLSEKEKQIKEQNKKELCLYITIGILFCSIGIGVYSKFKKKTIV